MTARVMSPQKPSSYGLALSTPAFEAIQSILAGSGLKNAEIGFHWAHWRSSRLHMSPLFIGHSTTEDFVLHQTVEAIEEPLLEILSRFRVRFGSTMVRISNGVPRRIIKSETIMPAEDFVEANQ